MQSRFVIILAFGLVLLLAGAVTRTYMNISIGRSALPTRSRTRSTELKYMRLIKEQGGARWPLIAPIILIPAGVILAFVAILLNNRASS